MKRVLFIANECEKGGATKSMLRLIELLKNDNVDIKVLTPKANGKVINFCKNNSIDCYYVKYCKVAFSLNEHETIKNVIKILLYPFLCLYTMVINNRAISEIHKIIDLNSIDYIHTNIIRDDIGMLLSKKYGVNHIMHLREYGKEDFNCIYLHYQYHKFLNKYTNKFIAISEAIKQAYIKKGIDAKKISVIYNGVDEVKNKKSDYNLKNNCLNMVIVGAISEAKGQIQVIKAIKVLKSKYGNYFNLYLYGDGEKKYTNYLRKKIISYGLESNVFFLGHREGAISELFEYDIAITPSRSEAFGRVTVEYMLAKLPVIVSNKGANSEIVVNNKGGLLYNYNNVQQLAECIYKLYSSINMRKEMSNYSYKYAIDNFTAKNNEKQILKLY